MQAFTPQQQSKLLANRNIQNVTEKSVTFNPSFKIKAVKQYLAGMPLNEIFDEAGIPLEFFKEDYCRLALKRWIERFQARGEDSLKEDGRATGSGRPKKERLEDLTYDELLTLAEIQKGALEEIKKQRALAKKK
jgi:hypothetical protein